MNVQWKYNLVFKSPKCWPDCTIKTFHLIQLSQFCKYWIRWPAERREFISYSNLFIFYIGCLFKGSTMKCRCTNMIKYVYITRNVIFWPRRNNVHGIAGVYIRLIFCPYIHTWDLNIQHTIHIAWLKVLFCGF